MNMAFTAGCFFILQCIFLMDFSVADPLIDVSPSEITLGTTSTLDINCTFSRNKHSGMAAFVSLVLSRANSTGQQFEDLAAITQFSPDSVTLLTQETVSATGVHSQTGETFLHLTWQYPTALQGGVYKCTAHGMDNIGYNVEMTIFSSVTVDKANLNDIFEKLQQLEMHEASMANTISNLGKQIQNLGNDKIAMEQSIQYLEKRTETLENDKLFLEKNIQILENDKLSLENYVAKLESNISHLVNLVEFVTPVTLLGKYRSKSYYISKYGYSNEDKSVDVCRSLGGQLAVIDNKDEFTAIQGFITATSGFGNVRIAGTDQQTEGKWVLPDTKTQVPFKSWGSGRPFTDRTRNCLWLSTGYSWHMVDYHCHFDPPLKSIRFLCEI